MVYEYTKYVINCFIEQETVPDIVQIGNEIGMVCYGSLAISII